MTTYEAEDGVCALEVFREMHPHIVWTCVIFVFLCIFLTRALRIVIYLCHGQSVKPEITAKPNIVPRMDGVVSGHLRVSPIWFLTSLHPQTAAKEMRKIEQAEGLTPSHSKMSLFTSSSFN